MLVLEVNDLELRCESSGQLPTWIGPAVRGMVAEHFKRRVCRHPEFRSRSDPLPNCVGCPVAGRCPYVQTFEPLRRVSAQRFADPIRPVVLQPQFPLPKRLVSGTRIGLRALLVGDAVDYADELVKAVDLAGRKQGIGPKRRRIPVRLERLHECERQFTRWRSTDLPQSVNEDDARAPLVRLELTSPLRIVERGCMIAEPKLPDLLRASIRVIRHLCGIYSRPLKLDTTSLMHAAASLRTVETDYRPFQQPIQSNKRRNRHKFEAITGHAVFHNVPITLLPWLIWGGRFHVGDRRVSGCGGWRIVLE